eukprot:2522649-Amphidinium_carterae.1
MVNQGSSVTPRNLRRVVEGMQCLASTSTGPCARSSRRQWRVREAAASAPGAESTRLHVHASVTVVRKPT